MSFPRYQEYKDSGVEWLGEVPAHWESWKISHAFGHIGSGTTPPSNEAAWYDEGEIPWVTTGELRENVITSTAKGVTREAVERFGSLRIYPPGSLVVAMYGATIGRLGVLGIHAATNQACCVLASPASLAVRFVFHWLSAFKERLIDLYAYGGGQPNISQEVVASLRIPAPSIEEQLSIATFLDRETAKIDALVAEQQNLIALLKEKRQALISHAVTKGLDPDVLMKDSGVAWLGEVPAHWVVLMLSRVASERCDGPFGSGIKSEHYTDSGALVVRLQNIRSNGFFVGEPAFLELEYFDQALKRHEVLPGDLLIAGLGDENNVVGRACVAPPGISPALVKADCFRFRLDGSVAAAAFVAAQLNVSAVADAGRLANGSTRSRIPLSVMATRVITLPPLAEQVEIITFIERERAAIDELVGEAAATIALLQERRTALISAAVTGKIDVRHLAVATADPTPEPA
jgi:type I restriction enzyme S subunit